MQANGLVDLFVDLPPALNIVSSPAEIASWSRKSTRLLVISG
jgi:hypothetical protein